MLSPSTYQARRELLPQSTEIYALYNNGILYGAIQEGIHQFFEKQVDKPENSEAQPSLPCLAFRNGEWKLSKVLSFEHKEKQLSSTH